MLRLKAYAKLNLSLKILGKRPDGYHELNSIMQSISLHDLISLELIPAGIELTCNNLRLPVNERNLAYRAAQSFGKEIEVGKMEMRGVKIFLDKRIPLAAGMAGGSADAAAVLYGLNKLHNSPFSLTELMKMGEGIGSDVPFCLVGGNCTVKGRGERVKKNPLHLSRLYVVVTPEVEVSSKWAYEAWDEMSNVPLDVARGQMSNEGIRNYLEPVVIKKYPVIQKIKEQLLTFGCRFAQMSGSGPTLFGEVSNWEAGEQIRSKMKETYSHSYLVETVERGIEIEG